MEKFTRMSPIGRVLRRKNKKIPENGYSIYLRVTVFINRIRHSTEISCRLAVPTKDNWKNGKIRGTTEDIRRLNTEITKRETAIQNIWEALRAKENFTYTLFISEVYRELGIEKPTSLPLTTETVLSLFDYCILTKSNSVCKRRKQMYIEAKRKMKNFLQLKYKKPDVHYSVLSRPFYYEFINYLEEKLKLKDSTVNGIQTILKTVAGNAEMDDLIPKNPFKGCKYKKIVYESKALSGEDLKKIEQSSDEKLPTSIVEAKYWFLIQTHLNISYGDFANFWVRMEKIGQDYIVKGLREKSKEPYVIWIRPIVFEYLKKIVALQNVESFHQLKFPVLETSNRRLKVLAAWCGISQNLSTHVSRHTHGTLYLNNGGRESVLQKSMGHSKVSQTLHYSRIHIPTIITEGKQVYNRLYPTKSKIKSKAVAPKKKGYKSAN